MNSRTKKLKENIIKFVTDVSVQNYLDEIDNYGSFLLKISQQQNLDTREIVINSPEMKAEYDFHKEKVAETFGNLKAALSQRELNKEGLSLFCDDKGYVEHEYANIIDLIHFAKFFAAIIRNHRADNLEMTLGERIQSLSQMDIRSKQMMLAELTCLKNQSDILEEKALQ